MKRLLRKAIAPGCDPTDVEDVGVPQTFQVVDRIRSPCPTVTDHEDLGVFVGQDLGNVIGQGVQGNVKASSQVSVILKLFHGADIQNHDGRIVF